MANYVYCTFQFEGFHFYSHAAKEVAYLRNKHRHMFHVKVYLEVMHGDREFEFITLKHTCLDIVKGNNFNNLSCEQIAEKLAHILRKFIPHYTKEIIVDVSEDGENGALFTDDN